MAKAKQQHAVWVVTTRTFEDGRSITDFSPRMSPRAEAEYRKAHGLKSENVHINRATGKPYYRYEPVTGLSLKGKTDADEV